MILKSGLILAAAAALLTATAVTPASAQTPLASPPTVYYALPLRSLVPPKYDNNAMRKLLDGDTPTISVLDGPQKRQELWRRSMRALHDWHPDLAQKKLIEERCRVMPKQCRDI